MARKLTSTKLVIYLLDKSRPNREEGAVFLCDAQGKIIQNCEEHFDALADLGSKVRSLLNGAGIKWP